MKKLLLFLGLCLMLMQVVEVDAQTPASNIWTLQQCIDYAINNNLQVKQNDLQAIISNNNASQAKMNRLPNLNANGSQGFNSGYSVDPFTNQFINQRINSNNFNITSNVTLFNGFQIHNNIKRTAIDAQVSQLNAQQSRNDVTLNVVQFYVQILLAKELLEASKQQVEITKTQLDRTEKLFKAGSVPEINVIDLQSQLANNEIAVVTSENQFILAKVQLQQALNLVISDNFDVQKIEIGEINAAPYPQTPTQIFQTSETTLPNIKAADLTIQSRDASIAIARGGRYPRLNFSVGSNTGYSSARSLFDITPVSTTQEIGFLTNDPTQTVSATIFSSRRTIKEYRFNQQLYDNRSYFASFNLNIPIFNGFQVKNNIRNAIVQKEIAETQAKQTRLQLRQTIEQAYTEVRSTANTYNARKKQVENLQTSFDVTEKRFNAGASNVVDYNIAKLNLDRAKTDLIRAKYDYVLRTKILDFYQGNSLEIK